MRVCVSPIFMLPLHHTHKHKHTHTYKSRYLKLITNEIGSPEATCEGHRGNDECQYVKHGRYVLHGIHVR